MKFNFLIPSYPRFKNEKSGLNIITTEGYKKKRKVTRHLCREKAHWQIQCNPFTGTSKLHIQKFNIRCFWQEEYSRNFTGISLLSLQIHPRIILCIRELTAQHPHQLLLSRSLKNVLINRDFSAWQKCTLGAGWVAYLKGNTDIPGAKWP